MSPSELGQDLGFELGDSEVEVILPPPGGGPLRYLTIFKAADGAEAIYGGDTLKLVGEHWLRFEENYPIDSNAQGSDPPPRAFRCRLRIKQAADPDSGTKQFRFGFTGIAADGVTLVDIHGGTDDDASQHLTEPLQISTGDGWQEYARYWRGSAATGTGGTEASADPLGAFHSDVRYVRPTLGVNIGATGDNLGTVEIEAFDADDATVELDAKNSIDKIGEIIDGLDLPSGTHIYKGHGVGFPPNANTVPPPKTGDVWYNDDPIDRLWGNGKAYRYDENAAPSAGYGGSTKWIRVIVDPLTIFEEIAASAVAALSVSTLQLDAARATIGLGVELFPNGGSEILPSPSADLTRAEWKGRVLASSVGAIAYSGDYIRQTASGGSIDARAPCYPGQSFIFKAQACSPTSATTGVNLAFFDKTGTILGYGSGTTTTVAVNSWAPVEIRGTAPASSVAVGFILYSGAVGWFDAVSARAVVDDAGIQIGGQYLSETWMARSYQSIGYISCDSHGTYNTSEGLADFTGFADAGDHVHLTFNCPTPPAGKSRAQPIVTATRAKWQASSTGRTMLPYDAVPVVDVPYVSGDTATFGLWWYHGAGSAYTPADYAWEVNIAVFWNFY